LHGPTQAPCEAVLATGQNVLSQRGELGGKVYPTEEIGRGIVKLHFDIVLLLDRFLIIVDVGTDDATAVCFRA